MPIINTLFLLSMCCVLINCKVAHNWQWSGFTEENSKIFESHYCDCLCCMVVCCSLCFRSHSQTFMVMVDLCLQVRSQTTFSVNNYSVCFSVIDKNTFTLILQHYSGYYDSYQICASGQYLNSKNLFQN